MVVAAVNNARRLPWYGLGASAVGAAIAIGDLGRVVRLGLSSWRSPLRRRRLVSLASLRPAGYR